MAKPIFICKVPNKIDRNNFYKIRESIISQKEFVEQYFCITTIHLGEDIEFQCFFDKDFVEADYIKLRDNLYKELNKLLTDEKTN